MTATMRGVLLRGPKQMALEEVPRPVPRADQVLVRVRYSACCATDFDLIDGTTRPSIHSSLATSGAAR